MASLTTPVVDCSPGNTLTLAGTGLTAGVGASVVLLNQGVVAPGPLTIPAAFAGDGKSVAFMVPDGAVTGTLVVTAADLSVATCSLIVASQYLQAAQYSSAIEGTIDNLAALTAASGVLDDVLRDASAFIDSEIGNVGLRLLQIQEDHEYRGGRGGHGPRVRPLRGPRQNIPLLSLDAFSFYLNNALTMTFTIGGPSSQIYANYSDGYFEVQGLAYGNAIFGPNAPFPAVGYSPDIVRIIYTAGFGWMQTPRAVRKATAIIATELMVNAGIIERGFGGLARVREGAVQYDRRSEEFALPLPVAGLLRPWTGTRF